MKKIIIGLIIILIIVGVIVYYLFNSKKKTMTINEFESLSYEWGTGLVPLEEAYGFPNLEINNNLEVIFFLFYDDNRIADYKYKISQKDLEKIIKSINDNNFLKLDDNLVENDCYDGASSIIKIRTKTYEKKVYVYCKENKKFKNVEDTIYDVVNKNNELTNYYKNVVEQAKILLNGDHNVKDN